jgi:hypothetical protein
VKLFSLIFAFYILLLSAVPCCAVGNCNDEIGQTQSGTTHKHNDDCKNCSPFALCGNCLGFAISTTIFQVDIPQQLTRQFFPGYKQSYLPQYISSFWQPPKLG